MHDLDTSQMECERFIIICTKTEVYSVLEPIGKQLRK